MFLLYGLIHEVNTVSDYIDIIVDEIMCIPVILSLSIVWEVSSTYSLSESTIRDPDDFGHGC